MSLRRVCAGIGLSISAVVASWAMAGPALAYDMTWKTTDGDPGGQVYWTEYGDKVKVCDIEEDGYAARAFVHLYNAEKTSRTYMYYVQAGGDGNCNTASPSDGPVYDLPERRYILISVCLIKAEVLDKDTCHQKDWIWNAHSS